MSKPEVTKCGLLTMQVCVPKEFTDEEAEAFANSESPTGLDHGWQMRHDGDEALAGDAARVQCLDPNRSDCVHIMFDC